MGDFASLNYKENHRKAEASRISNEAENGKRKLEVTYYFD